MSTVHIPLTKISHNPWQPRLHEDPAKVEELKDSILANYEVLPKANRGLYHIPLARVIDENGVVIKGAHAHELAAYVESGEASVQLVFGHRRFAAFKLLAGGSMGEPPDDRFGSMPLELAALGDLDIAVLAARENVERVDLSWFERAQAMNRFIADFDMNQAEVAPLFGLSDKSSVSQYVRALEALTQFNHIDLLHWARAGRLPLLHALKLIPLLRDKPIEARQWLARNTLVNEESGDVVSAAWINSEVERFIPPKPSTQPAEPTPESGMSWDKHFQVIQDQHPGIPVFMEVGQTGSVWVVIGPRATTVAEKLGAQVGTLKVVRDLHIEPVLATAVWMGSPASDERLRALESLIGKFHTYQEPSKELMAMVETKLHKVSQFRAPEPAAPEVPAPARSPSNGAPIPGMPPAGLRPPQPQRPAPAAEPEEAAPAPAAEPPAPIMSQEERQAAAEEQMRRLFPGAAAASPQSQAEDQPADYEPDVQLVFSEVADLLLQARDRLASLSGAVSETDQHIVDHLQEVGKHTLNVYIGALQGLSEPGVLDSVRDTVAASEAPEKDLRRLMMNFSNSSIQREAIG